MGMTVFDMVFAVSDAVIAFSSAFWNFVSMPFGAFMVEISWVKNVPFLGDFLLESMSFISPLTPLDILAGGGMTVIMILIVIKKVIPLV